MPGSPQSPFRSDRAILRSLHRKRLLFVAGFVLAFAVPLIAGISPWFILLFMFLLHMYFLWGQLVPNSQVLGPVVTSFHPLDGQRAVWLTIDDGPEPEETPDLLDVLDRFQAKATFFLIGEKAAAYPYLVREIARRGHQVANHSATHPQSWFWALWGRRLRYEIDMGEKILRMALRHDEELRPLPPFFRSPVGMKPPGLHPMLARRGLHFVGWSVRGRDGVSHPRVGDALLRLMVGVKPGAILMMHEGRGHAVELLERLIPELQEEGYACVIPSPDSLQCRSRGDKEA